MCFVSSLVYADQPGADLKVHSEACVAQVRPKIRYKGSGIDEIGAYTCTLTIHIHVHGV